MMKNKDKEKGFESKKRQENQPKRERNDEKHPTEYFVVLHQTKANKKDKKMRQKPGTKENNK